MVDLFEEICGEIIKRKYPNYLKDSLIVNWIEKIINNYNKDINNCNEIFIQGFNYGIKFKKLLTLLTKTIS